ncbi:tRNA (guanine(37)-N1)-methyltransferase [Symbiodinium microadriaticum]|uniref:tRNA (guanine(37)-N1)-methyltransferase n=1 Tax=Symbiodinium microadriaticum TaxID=2951 RepID=A0A1Q9CUU9_SYMMI|nr:tRNA (guanine(37)-N1)-methyltransferase [Symbiodinium microadriaticum]
MVEHMTAAVKGGPQLTQEERNLLSVAFKNAVSARRCALEFARRDEVRAKSDPQAGVYVREYMDQVRDELEHLCLAVLHLLDGSLIPAAPDSESLVFYIKMKADYHRHMATFGQRAAYAREKARQSYREAELLAVRLSVIHPVRLGLALNYSIFLRELMNDATAARSKARSAFDGALTELESLDSEEDHYKDSTLILQLLRIDQICSNEWSASASRTIDGDNLRLAGIPPILTILLVIFLSASAVYHGWIHPIGFWEHGSTELVLFSTEVACLLISYLAAVLRGPGFVPFGWCPTEEDIGFRFKFYEGAQGSGLFRLLCAASALSLALPPQTLLCKFFTHGAGNGCVRHAGVIRHCIDRATFSRIEHVWAVKAPGDGAYRLRQLPEVLPLCYGAGRKSKLQNFQNVMTERNGACEPGFSLLLLAPNVTSSNVPQDVHDAVQGFEGSFTEYELKLGYENFDYKEVLTQLLPSNVAVPMGYEVVGHIAHFNLLPEHWPHRHVIGQVLLDKARNVRTAVAKRSAVTDEFRTFDMEVIAGEADTVVEVTEFGLKLQFDFRKVYWNSRLASERGRILKECRQGEAFIDLAGGVGALALLCARKGCHVVVNDLNPEAAAAAKQNAQRNRLSVDVLQMDASLLLRSLLRGNCDPGLPGLSPALLQVNTTRLCFNLPELALELFSSELRPLLSDTGVEGLSTAEEGLRRFCAYCYTFDYSEEQVLKRLEHLLNYLPQATKIRKVRLVAPRKIMYCVKLDFYLRATSSELSTLRSSIDPAGLPVAVEAPPVSDLLQWCASCKGYKPPRAHHCSTCGRCVLSMDHHCPWTNTCVGQINMKPFVQFVHFVPIATLHALVVHSELFILLLYGWKNSRKSMDFVRIVVRLRILLGLIAWFCCLVVMLLVGTLAWEMEHTVVGNISMIEEYVLEKAEMRRRRTGERKFVYPYDLGRKENFAAVLGSSFSWLVPGLATPGEPVWPPVRAGCTHFDISTEQIAQKMEKLQRSMVMPVREHFTGEGRCCLSYWCWICYRFGCCAVCDCEACGEERLSVEPGQAVLVSKSEGSWAHGRKMPDGGLNGAGITDTSDVPFGWLPRRVLASSEAVPYEIPFQKELQGHWEAADGRVIALHRHRVDGAEAVKSMVSSCFCFEADDVSSCRSWDRTRTPDASPQEIVAGEYELSRSLGVGGSATMHLGQSLRTGRSVAVKTIAKETKAERAAAFDEAEILQTLDHEKVNRLIHVDEDQFNVYLILEYAEGVDLMENLLEHGPFDEQQAANIMRQVLDAICHCHTRGIVHRDLKPENIMVAMADGEAKVTVVDFGLATAEGTLLDGGELEGTGPYLAPEARREAFACSRALDSFSLGVVLFAMLSGRLPSAASPRLASADFLPNLTSGARDFLARLLYSDPAERLGAAEALSHPWLA